MNESRNAQPATVDQARTANATAAIAPSAQDESNQPLKTAADGRKNEDAVSDFKTENVGLRQPDVYQVVIRHMQTAEWRPAPLMTWLYDWSRLLIVEFDLRVPVPPIKLDRLHSRVLGHYLDGHNCWGREGEIALNTRHLENLPAWQVLGILLHELLHSHQYNYGKPGRPPYHNKEYRAKAASLGLLVDQRGVTEYANARQPDEDGIVGIDATSPFRALLAKHDIEMPLRPPPSTKVSGRSTLSLWMCECKPPQLARIGRGTFHANCPLCGEPFRRAGWRD